MREMHSVGLLLTKHLTSILKPLTDQSQHKLQSTDNFIDAIKTVQILRRQITFHQHPTLSCPWLYLGIAINKSHYQSPSPTVDLMDLLLTFVWPKPTFNTTVNTTSNCMEQLWAHLFPSLRLKYSSHAKHWGAGPSNLQSKSPFLTTLRWRYNHCCIHTKNDEFHENLNKQ